MKVAKKIKKGDIFEIFVRQRMGADAQTTTLTQEKTTGMCFSKKSAAVEWVQKQEDHGKIFTIRDREGNALHTYRWKSGRNQ